MPSARQFIAARSERWSRLQSLLKRSGGNGLRTLDAPDLDALGSGYRSVAADLALARRDFPLDGLTVSLNHLAANTHMRVYQAPGGSIRRVAEYFTLGFARRVRAAGGYLVVSAVLLLLPGLWAYLAALVDPALRDVLVPADLRQLMANGQTWTDIPQQARPLAASLIFTNNIRVAFFAFAGGALFGLGTIWALVENGLMLGGVLGAAQYFGVAPLLWAFISAHGYLEMSCIVIAGAAGLSLGDGLLRPGPLRRGDAALRAARRAVDLAMGVAPILMVAGLVEGLVSPSGAPALLKMLVGPCLGLGLWALLLTLGRPTRR